MNQRSGAVFWGLMLIVVGVIFLLRETGILRIAWGQIWPIFLILLGGWLLLGNFARRGSAATSSQSIPLDGAREARIEVHHGAGELRVGSSNDAAALVNNIASDDLRQDVRRDGDRLDVMLRQDRDWTYWLWPGNWGSSNHWTMNVNRDVPLSLVVHTGASTAHLDLRELKVRDFRVEVGASTVNIDAPTAGQVTGRIKAGAATVRIRVPDGVAARVRASLGAATLNVRGTRFPWQGGMYQSPDFDTAANRVDLDIDGGASTIDVI